MRKRVGLILVAIISLNANAQQKAASSFDFSIKNIMRGPELYGRAPDSVRWTADNKWIYFNWVEPGANWLETPKPYRVRALAGSNPERVTRAHMDTVGPLLQEGDRSANGRSMVVVYNGDLYLNDLHTGTTRRLTQTIADESSPLYSADDSEIFFVRDSTNVFELNIGTGALRQLTDLRSAAAPVDSAAPTGQRGRLAQQQRDLFDAIRDLIRADSISKAGQKDSAARGLKPIYVGRNLKLSHVNVAPSGMALLVTATVPAEGRRIAQVPRWVTESGYIENVRTFELVGDIQESDRLAYVSLPSGQVKWVKIFPSDSINGSITTPQWNKTGTTALFYAFTGDNKTRYFESLDAATGSVKTIATEHDSAWVNNFWQCYSCFGWYDGGRRVWYTSERDGYNHLYSSASDGSDSRRLTEGKWEVIDASLSPDERYFYLRTNEVSPFDEHAYRMSTAGGAREQLTSKPGRHRVTISPDQQWGADVYSYVNRPPDLYLIRLRPGSDMSELTVSPSAEWLSFPWIAPEIVMIPASDGAQVPAHVYRPADMGAQPNGAAVIFVHGAGYLHNVGHFWSEYPREYRFNQFLAAHGYVVLDLDYRASQGYGRDWRTAIYRHMGGRDLQDQVDASRYLGKTFNIDPERVGIYGGSYGGFITLMALFTEPKHFGAGAAIRSVTDWAHYNAGYTSNILNNPQTDTLAFRQSSPIYFAEGLEDPLLMLHGMVDTNVPFQDIVRLTERLIELGKPNWELAVYPVENHAFVRPSSWTDEYSRIFNLFETWLPSRVPLRNSPR
jgi:dipeptidyl aminopeptidase/acylaminoacyl peptidase